MVSGTGALANIIHWGIVERAMMGCPGCLGATISGLWAKMALSYASSSRSYASHEATKPYQVYICPRRGTQKLALDLWASRVYRGMWNDVEPRMVRTRGYKK